MLLKVSLLEGGPRGGGVTSKARLELETRWMESEFVAGPILEKFNYSTSALQLVNISVKGGSLLIFSDT